jgi:hypothetical protein
MPVIYLTIKTQGVFEYKNSTNNFKQILVYRFNWIFLPIQTQGVLEHKNSRNNFKKFWSIVLTEFFYRYKHRVFLNTKIPRIILNKFWSIVLNDFFYSTAIDSDSLRAGRSGDRIPVRAGFSAPVQTCPEVHPASCTTGTGFFPGGKKRPGRGVDHPPYLAPRLKKE